MAKSELGSMFCVCVLFVLVFFFCSLFLFGGPVMSSVFSVIGMELGE